MSTHMTHGSPKELHDGAQDGSAAERTADIDRVQLLQDADTLIVLVLENITEADRAALTAAHPLLWSIRQQVMESTDREVQRFNAMLGLWAVAQYPEVLQQAVLTLRARLADRRPLSWLDALGTAAGGHRHDH